MNFDIEQLLMRLYNDSRDKFYAYLFFQVDRKRMSDLPAPMGVGLIDQRLKLVYNDKIMEELIARTSTDHAITILKHEALHLINKHLEGISSQDKKSAVTMKMWNIAQDCAINQILNSKHIEDIGGVTLENFSALIKHKGSGFVADAHQTSEYYFSLLSDEKEDRQKKGDGSGEGEGEGGSLEESLDGMKMDSHDLFGSMDALDKAMLEEKLRKAYNDAKKASAGNIPSEIEDMFKVLFGASKVNWRRELRRFFGSGIRSEKKATRAKLNRRYGIKFAGKKKDYKAKILTVIDTSASMSNPMIQKAIDEVYGIYKASPNLQVDIVECDTEIKDVFTYEGKEKFSIKGRGGTEFQPALDYAKNNKYDGIIFLTDGGYWTPPKNTGVPVLWGIIGGYDFNIDFGTVLKIEE